MKSILLAVLILLTFTSIGYAQGGVADTHPNSYIYAFDYASGQSVPIATDGAILFKDAIIDLVSNTPISRGMVMRAAPAPKMFIVKQADPSTSGNKFQVSLQYKLTHQNIYVFEFTAGENTLAYFDSPSQSYINVQIDGPNLNNLNNCIAYANFNPPADAATGPAPDDNTPVDANVSASTAPPDMPDYQQPECPVDGYLWQPGYWAFSPASGGYYWVPGIWSAPPNPGLLWTPPYWGFLNGVYAFNVGYWGATVGFYGGVYYGFGYGGHGFVGGNWDGGHFRYNTAVVRVNTTVIHNTYVDNTVIVNRTTINNTSFNGGPHGINARPSPEEMRAAKETHVPPTADQIRNQKVARNDKTQYAAANGGHPDPAKLAAAKAPERSALPASHPTNTGSRPASVSTPARPNGQSTAIKPAGAAPGTATRTGVGAGQLKPGAAQLTGARPGTPGAAKPGVGTAAKGVKTPPKKAAVKTPPKKD
jgi:hypothetical protein